MINWFKREIFVLPIQLNHAIEIGAELAYRGHHKATGDFRFEVMANDESKHQEHLKLILKHYESDTCAILDITFFIIGSIIAKLCLLSPPKLMLIVAYILEYLAIWSYATLAKKYEEYEGRFELMEHQEIIHKQIIKESLNNGTYSKEDYFKDTI